MILLLLQFINIHFNGWCLFICWFVGVNCEENLDECLSNPCQNGGTCDDRDNGYVCYCSLGYAGTHCEMDVAVCDTGNQLIKYWNKLSPYVCTHKYVHYVLCCI